jgi:hypothetical protein
MSQGRRGVAQECAKLSGHIRPPSGARGSSFAVPPRRTLFPACAEDSPWRHALWTGRRSRQAMERSGPASRRADRGLPESGCLWLNSCSPFLFRARGGGCEPRRGAGSPSEGQSPGTAALWCGRPACIFISTTSCAAGTAAPQVSPNLAATPLVPVTVRPNGPRVF